MRLTRRPFDESPVHKCLVNADWTTGAHSVITIARTTEPGLVAVATFVVDRWGMGLEACNGRLDTPISEFEEVFPKLYQKCAVVKLEVLQAKHLVHGAVRWSKQVGFSRPKDHERWLSVLGPLPAGVEPDMSLFGVNGKIRLVCSAEQFRSRLIGQSPASFLARDDVEFVVEDAVDLSSMFGLVHRMRVADPLVDNDDDHDVEFDDGDFGAEASDDELDEIDPELSEVDLLSALGSAAQEMVNGARRWYFAQGRKPHALLPAVAHAFITSLGPVLGSLPDDDAVEPKFTDEQVSAVHENAWAFLMNTGLDPVPHGVAFDQMIAYLRQGGSSPLRESTPPTSGLRLAAPDRVRG